MRRYRLLRFDFDTRSRILATEIQEGWDEQTKKLIAKNKQQIQERLVAEFGSASGDRKTKDFMDLDAMPFSVVAFHNKFLRQARAAFVIGAYYPALTAACALGERILNHLVLVLRDCFKKSPEYKKVYRKESFDDWSIAIKTLESWGVLLPDVADRFCTLMKTRNSAIHFRPDTDKNDRALALLAIQQLSAVVAKQFGALPPKPWLIPSKTAIAFIRKNYETDPFVEKVWLPCCKLVGPAHQVRLGRGEWVVTHDEQYEDREISDEQFITQFIKAQSARS